MSRSNEYSLCWEKILPADEKDHAHHRIPPTLWVPHCGAQSIVSLLNEVWGQQSIKPEAPLSADRLFQISNTIRTIVSPVGFGCLARVRDELFSSDILDIKPPKPRPHIMFWRPSSRSCHETVFCAGWCWSESIASAISFESYQQQREEDENAVMDGPPIISIETALNIFTDDFIKKHGFRNAPEGWDHLAISLRLSDELYEAIGRRKLSGFAYEADKNKSHCSVPSPLDAFEKLLAQKKDVIEANPYKKRISRDLLFLEWETSEGLTPSAIRDRWNKFSDEEREKICPEFPGAYTLNTVRQILRRSKNL